eukprot:9468863-Pyramimonas_sp.AAC.1
MRIKGDWAEHSKTLGLASWASKFSPCQYCSLPKCDLHMHNCSIESDVVPFPLRAACEYEQACQTCERHVTIHNEGQRDAVVRALTCCHFGGEFRTWGSRGAID